MDIAPLGQEILIVLWASAFQNKILQFLTISFYFRQ
jgi:hypothetical protein